MPVVVSSFHPPLWLRNPHLQTVWAAVARRGHPSRYERERLELPDGDFLDLDWSRAGHGRLAILSHGLEGSSSAGYVRGMAAALNTAAVGRSPTGSCASTTPVRPATSDASSRMPPPAMHRWR